MKTTRFVVLSYLVTQFVMGSAQFASADPLITVYSFPRISPTEYLTPRGDLATDGTRLFGTTRFGGTSNQGSVYAFNGNGYQTLHSFLDNNPSPPFGGFAPQGGLLVSGGNIYGAAQGGPQQGGIYFHIDQSSNYFVDNWFSAFQSSSFGFGPAGNLISGPGGRIIGTTAQGVSNYNGAVVGLATPNAPAFSLPVGAGAASNPAAGVVNSGNTYFGTTLYGGAFNHGAIFSVNFNGSNYHLIHSFDGSGDGAGSTAHLLVVGDKIFGTTNRTLYSFNTDGTGYQVLRSDTDTGGSGLTSVGNKLYGVTAQTVYRIDMDGSNYEVIHQATSGEGFLPDGGLTQMGHWLYGVSQSGGADGGGYIYALPLEVPEPSTFAMAAAALTGLLFFSRRRRAT